MYSTTATLDIIACCIRGQNDGMLGGESTWNALGFQVANYLNKCAERLEATVLLTIGQSW